MLRNTFIVCLFSCVINTAVTQPLRTYNFQRFSTEWVKIDKGLSQNSVFTLLQDRDGFMWFGTWDGLNKFDGYQFSIFRPDKYSTHSSISNETIRCLYEDEEGFLWVGTEEGLNRLNRYSLEFKHFKKNPKALYSINSDTVFSIIGDNNELLYIGTNNGLNIYDKKTEVFFNVDLSSGLKDNHAPLKIYSLYLFH